MTFSDYWTKQQQPKKRYLWENYPFGVQGETLTIPAHDKSHARALIKRLIGAKRLPVGAKIVEVTR